MHLPPSPVREVDLDQGSRAWPSLGPWETPKGRVALGHLAQAPVALPCLSSLSVGVLDATVGRGGRGGGREIGKAKRAAHPGLGWGRHRYNSPTLQHSEHTSPFLASPSTHSDCESHYLRRARDFLNIYSPLSAR